MAIIDIEINVFDVDVILRHYLAQKLPGMEVRNITVKSWNFSVMELEDDPQRGRYLNTEQHSPARHVLRQEHSTFFKDG